MSNPIIKRENPSSLAPASRWQLLRDVLAFQFKLAMDGLRDILLSPVSIVAAIIGILTSGKEPGRYFYRLLEFGHKTDRWINLFNSYSDDDPARESPTDSRGADAVVKKAEAFVVDEYRKGGVVQKLKDNADKAIDRLQP